jgi:N,N'-diacetyllegionaminate synthase
MNRKIIAEIGSVHDGSFGNACKLIEAAAASGADVVKFQTHIAEAETLPNAPMPPYFQGEPRLEYFRRTAFTQAQCRELMKVASGAGVEWISSPFSLEAVDFLEELGMAVYKIPSGEVSNLPLHEKIATTGKPVLLSSGMSSWAELDRAVAVYQKAGTALAIMQCTTEYPCAPEHVGLNVLAEIRERYGVPAGFSDHTPDLAAPIAAAALGATVIEKHFAFSRLMYGSDARHSLEPGEFRQMADAIRATWKMLDHPVDKTDAGRFAEMKRVFEKSVVSAAALPAGKVIEAGDLAFKKPGDGIPAADYTRLLGRRLKADVPADHKFSPSDFQET